MSRLGENKAIFKWMIFIKANRFSVLLLLLGLVSLLSSGEGVAGTLRDVKARGNEKRRGCILKNQIDSYGFVLRYLPYDEAYLNVDDDHVVIFLPNLLIAGNDLKLVTVYSSTGRDDKVPQVKKNGEYYPAESLKSVKTEWAGQVQKGFEDESPKK